MNHSKKIKVLICILIVLVICASGVTYALYGTYQSLKENPISAFVSAGPAAATDSGEGQKKKAAPTEMVTIDGKTYGKDPNTISILMLGVDWDGSDEVKDATGKRSDMIMLCTVDLDANKISFDSFPRDTRTTVHAVDKKTGEIQDKTYLTKLNHAYALGALSSDEAGAENTMLAMQDLVSCEEQLNIPIDYYVSIDLGHLSDLAGALGGVEVTLDQDYPDLGDKGETINLEGDNVRLYLQNRKQMEDGEMDRQRHEQNFMMALAKKIKDIGAVNAATKLFPQMAGKVIQTNLNIDQIVAMAGALDQIGSIDDIEMTTFEEKDDSWENFSDPLVSGAKLDYFIMDQDELLQKMLMRYYEEQ